MKQQYTWNYSIKGMFSLVPLFITVQAETEEESRILAFEKLGPKSILFGPPEISDIKTVFVSGHLDLTEEEFREHYVPKLLYYCEQGYNFVVGDARGADTLTQKFLAENQHKPYVLVYHMFNAPRNLHGEFCTAGGYTSDEERDEEMTIGSDEDLAWVRPGREKSGTARNLNRRNL